MVGSVVIGTASNMKTEYFMGHEILGKGSFSVVKMAWQTPCQKRVAAKVVDLWKNKDVFEREVNALARLSHSNIVQYLDSQLFADGTGAIFLEYLPFPTLQNHLNQNGALSLEFALRVFSQLVDAMEHMHGNNVAHMDMKTENLSYDPATHNVKLFDFGLSQLVDPRLPVSENFVGSPMYMAPEVLMRDRFNPLVADVWSLGVVLYELLTGRTPFANFVCMDELLDYVCFESSIPMPPSLPPPLAELLRSMLHFNPAQRISISSVKTYLNQHFPFRQSESTEHSAVQCF